MLVRRRRTGSTARCFRLRCQAMRRVAALRVGTRRRSRTPVCRRAATDLRRVRRRFMRAASRRAHSISCCPHCAYGIGNCQWLQIVSGYGRRAATSRGCAPGPELAARLAAIDPADLDDDYDVLEVVAAWDRLKSWVGRRAVGCGRGVRSSAVVDRAEPRMSRARSVGRWGRCGAAIPMMRSRARLSISSGSAGFRVGLAIELAGGVDGDRVRLWQRARSMCRRRTASPTGAATWIRAPPPRLRAIVLARAGDQTNAQLKKAVRKAAIAADPVAAQKRHVAAKNERGVWLTPLDDGMAQLHAVMAAADATEGVQRAHRGGAVGEARGWGNPQHRPVARRFPARPFR